MPVRLAALGALLALAALAFMALDAKGCWSFLLPFRGVRLAALALVGATVAVATVLFQTVSGNRILTPSIMGLDALYLLFQSALVFTLGGLGYGTLGREPAIGLGVNHAGLIRETLLIVALLVSVSTTLAGPVAFFGLLVASLARLVVDVPRHALLLPAAAMIGAAILIAGQTVFERVLRLESTLSVVIEFAGGILFLVLLLRVRPA